MTRDTCFRLLYLCLLLSPLQLILPLPRGVPDLLRSSFPDSIDTSIELIIRFRRLSARVHVHNERIILLVCKQGLRTWHFQPRPLFPRLSSRSQPPRRRRRRRKWPQQQGLRPARCSRSSPPLSLEDDTSSLLLFLPSILYVWYAERSTNVKMKAYFQGS